jgi:hypothetical protein
MWQPRPAPAAASVPTDHWFYSLFQSTPDLIATPECGSWLALNVQRKRSQEYALNL